MKEKNKNAAPVFFFIKSMQAQKEIGTKVWWWCLLMVYLLLTAVKCAVPGIKWIAHFQHNIIDAYPFYGYGSLTSSSNLSKLLHVEVVIELNAISD